MPAELSRHVTDAPHPGTCHIQPSGSAAVEYTDLLPGRCEFVVHDRLLPWDRPAPALVLREADRYVPPIERQVYSPRSKHPVTLAASGADTTDRLRHRLGRA